MNLIDGRKLAEEIRSNLKTQISSLGFAPGLGVILVGNNPASHLYIKLKEQACAEVGIKFEKAMFPDNAPQEEINLTIQQFNNRSDIHGILVQFPLPKNFDTDKIISAIDPKKDVDGFHPENLEAIKSGKPNIIPGVALGILKLIESTDEPLKNKKAALLVNSETFALPIKYLLEKSGVEVETILNTQYLILDTYDIIVIAIGRPKFLKADMVKDGAIIIDVGTNILDGETVGDADFDSFKNKNGWITPVPGGVGPMTVAMLLQNVYNLAVKK